MLLLSICGCVNQHPKESGSGNDITSSNNGIETAQTADAILDISEPAEQAAVQTAKEKVKALGREPRLIATSVATAEICDRLEIELVGVCSSSVSTIPSRYDEATQVGTAMSPDMEIIASLNPDWILSPASLQSDLQPKYETIDTDWAFLNLRSVQGMYRSIQELGEIFDRQEQATALVTEFEVFYKEYIEKNKGKESPKVLILMGLPGSYIIATENSYVGSLVELAGGENVYAGTNQEFLTVNTEDMKTKEPDVILRAAHALPEQVIEMFKEDFETNDIWKHFEAVQKGRVYDLSYDKFGMSATFAYPEALEELQPLLYPEEVGAENKDSEKNTETDTNLEKEAE